MELETGPYAAGGGCARRADDGRVVFVRHTLPGERVLATLTEETKSYLRADTIQIIDTSPDACSPLFARAEPGGVQEELRIGSTSRSLRNERC